tara:strand:- start:2753 stop:3328 length:576 start_codon:yes stop_codon:yes gene_type:complete
MAQTSTTLLASKSHIANVTGTDITFTASGTEYKITSTSTALNGFAVRDLITVSGTTNNNSTFTVKTVTSANQLIVEEVVTSETADGSTTTTLDHTGFVSDKAKGDGYYSQPDGVHTVAYQVNATLTGSIKIQGSLATTPTEDDWFDIAGSTFTADQSTLIGTANFTGNFVWVRAKATSVTAGTISSVLINA